MNKINNLSKITIGSCIVTTLIITPWVNVDSMIIPKLIMLALTAAYLLPSLLIIIKTNLHNMNWILKSVLICVLLIIIQMILVMFFTNSPLEQQFFGKTGRGLGFLTYFSLLILFTISIYIFQKKTIFYFFNGLFYSSFFSSIYSILQFYGYDIFNWESRTNGIIGTIGNPNFQSSFSAIALVSSLNYFIQKSWNKKILATIHSLVLLYTIYLCQSWQGYGLVIITLIALLLIYTWNKSRVIFSLSSLVCFLLAIPTVLGMINIGPFSGLLYKYSVKSRGEMWRSSFSASKDNPVFGIGLDSFGDYSLMYKNLIDLNGVNEFTDNSHNYYLEFFTTGGLLLLILNLTLIGLTFYSFVILMRRSIGFELQTAMLFCVWICLIAQSLISPATIPLLIWSYVLSGVVIGLASENSIEYLSSISKVKSASINFLNLRWVFVILVFILLYPYYNVDRLHRDSARSGDALLAIKVAQMYPQSVLRYQRIGRELLESNLPEQALVVARAATQFNPNSFSGWALVLSNGLALDTERKEALQELERIDPLNPEIKAFKP
jgi:O-antigen ligase